MSQTILYARVSTSEQTIDHQEVQTRAAGFTIDHVVADHGVSGVAVKLADRPNGKRLFDMLRRGDTLVVRWIDRLGRDYTDVTETIRTLMRRGVVVQTIINSMTFDGATEDPVQMAVRDALIGFMAATAQAQGEATKAAQKAGIAYAKEKGGQTSYRGRQPSFTRDHLSALDSQLASGASISSIAKAIGLTRQTIYRLRDNRAEAEAALLRWQKQAAA